MSLTSELITTHGKLDYERGGTQKEVYAADEVVEVPCPFCASESRGRLYTEHGHIGISQCKDCELIYTSPRIQRPEEIYWGDTTKYLAEARLIFDGKAAHHRDPNYLEELDLIARYKPRGRFLDVGCNMGFLLRKVRDRGWTAVGCEPSPSLSKVAREKWGLEVHNCFLNELPASMNGSFDVVALSDVFEHISSPLPFLADVKRLLAPDGVLYVKVPNGRWSVFKQQVLGALGRRPAHGIWDSYEHVVHYNGETLTKMIQKGGFRVEKLAIGSPIQIPVWHHHVGAYYQYATPVYMDWKRKLGRSAFYYASFAERLGRLGSIGAMAPNLVVVARHADLPG